MRVDAPVRGVSGLSGRVRAGVFLRSFAIQGSWNYRSLIGHGFAFALLPALRTIHRHDPRRLDEALDRHAQLFNSHPYLAPMALGAVARLEADGEDPVVVDRFKTALRGSLGTVGDRLVWAGLRPVCLLFALALLFTGAPWWLAVTAFLVVYNAGHLLLRSWSFRLGLREGKRIAERIRRSALGTVQRYLPVVGTFLVGLLVPLSVGGRHLKAIGLPSAEAVPVAWIVAAAIAAMLGVRFGALVRTPVILALVGFTVFGLLVRVLQ